MNPPSQPATRWGLALEGPDPKALIRWLAGRIWPGRTPEQVVLGCKPHRPKADWLDRIEAGGKEDAAAYFRADRTESLVAHPSGVVNARFPFALTVDAARRWLETAPFEVASFEPLHDDWSTLEPDYLAPSFGRRHIPHGWGCAFKGRGHERLVSRRWLDFGPWVCARGANDLSLVQFHAWTAPAAEALAQAKPAHAAMGIADEGGFLQRPYVFKTALAGLYEPDEQILRLVVLGREIPAIELRDARAAVLQGALGPDRPLRRVAYVFPKPAEAQRWLLPLWLRELECWTVIDGVERRLDAEFTPRPAPPEWAREP